MSVRKRTWTTPSGITKCAWVTDYRDQSGTRRLRTFSTKREASDFSARANVEIKAGVHTADSASLTVFEAALTWLQSGHETSLEKSTMDQREQHIRLHIEPFLGAIKLSQLTAPRIRTFESALRASGRSEAMVRKVLISLSSILSDATERGTVARNVVRELRGKRRPGMEKRAADRRRGRAKVGLDIPAPSEVKAILSALCGHYRPIILTALFTGLRASELRGLHWKNVDLENRVIHVRERADKNNRIGPPKSKAGERSVPLPPLVTTTLKEIWLRSAGTGLVFGTRSGRPDYIQNIIKRGWIPAQIMAGVTDTQGGAKYTGLHAARHFYASWCINPPAAGGCGLTPKTVQVRLGHSSIGMTLDVYGHLFPSDDDGDKLAAAEAKLLA